MAENNPTPHPNPAIATAGISDGKMRAAGDVENRSETEVSADQRVSKRSFGVSGPVGRRTPMRCEHCGTGILYLLQCNRKRVCAACTDCGHHRAVTLSKRRTP